MFTEFTKKMITLLVILAVVAFVQPAFGRDGGGGGTGRMGGGGHFNGASNFNNVSHLSSSAHFSASVNHPMTNFNRGFDSRHFESRGIHNGGFGSFGNDRFVGGRRFSDHDDRFFHERHFRDRDGRFFFDFDPFFDRSIFFNPCFGDFGCNTGFFIGAPYYPYYYDNGPYYTPYVYDYGTSPSTYNTYNYYVNPAQPATGYDNGTVNQPAVNQPTGQVHQSPTPAAQAQANSYFNEGVKAFKGGDYGLAAEKLAAAKTLVPQDKVLPFAYAQAVFASGDYFSAAAAIRAAVAKVRPETEGVFYPRGMYSDDAALPRQISMLAEAVRLNENNANLQLVLGYNELGMGEIDKAEAALKLAGADQTNAPAANSLLKLVNKIRTTKTETPNTAAPAPDVPKAETPAY